MELKLESVVLETKNKQSLVSFLTSLFDFEVKSHEDNYYFHLNGTKLTISEVKRLTTKYRNFHLSLTNNESLDDLKKKIDFYYYREGAKTPLNTIKNNILEFVDPDGCHWYVHGSNNAL